jgi:LPXTG-motif cell wall-anchored protein
MPATPTPVVVFATETPTPGGDGIGAGADLNARTATVSALLTLAAGGGTTPNATQASQTAAAKTPTALPTTGFADDVGLPGLLGVALLLVTVIVLTRRLRTAAS